MKKSMLGIIALAALTGSTLLAQSLTGTWQGTLKVPQAPKGELRVVLQISTTDADTLKTVMYSIDQGGQPISASTTTVSGSAVKILVPGIGGTYEGRVNADGNSMSGQWTQGPEPLTLNLTRATPQTAWTIPEPPPPPKPMPANADPSFEVATIKPSKPGQPGRAFRVNGREFSTINTSVSDMMVFAYGVHARQVTGGPDWFEKDKYDVLAKPDVDGQPNDKQLKSMVQKLLADRFKLTFHRDKKELSVYAIVVAKGGPKLTKSESDAPFPSLFFRGLGNLPARNATMADFAGVMQSAVLDKPVVDLTGLTGRFDFSLMWTPDEFQFGGLGVKPPAPSDKDTQPDLYTAFQQQLGLRLESTKAQAEVLVIDHVERPSEN
jgi:uncharacterized protein (TIGR03435 family)